MSDDGYIRYALCRAERATVGETRDCSVIAAAVVSDLPYMEVHREFEHAGRKYRRGTFLVTTKKAMRKLGFKVIEEEVPRNPGKTWVTIGQCFPKGRYLIASHNHMGALIDGTVIDHSPSSRRRVQTVWRIVKND